MFQFIARLVTLVTLVWLGGRNTVRKPGAATEGILGLMAEISQARPSVPAYYKSEAYGHYVVGALWYGGRIVGADLLIVWDTRKRVLIVGEEAEDLDWELRFNGEPDLVLEERREAA